MKNEAKDPYNLKPAWDAILDVYKPFAEICGRHNLRMWASSGNVLGAVRHKGFIPWDDDFDVMMPRRDYERFVNEYARELPTQLQVVSTRNTPEYTLPFVKIQDVRKDVIESVEARIGRSMPQGIYVDVFPLDGYVPGKSKLGSPFWKHVWKFRRAWFCRKYYPKSAKSYFQFALGFLCGVFTPFVHSKRQYEEKYERLMQEFPFDGSDYCVYYDGIVLDRPCFPTAAFATTRMLPYEDIEVPVPGDYDTYLKCEYGPDYMTPPPPSARISNHQESPHALWKFGPTEVIK